MKNKFVLLPLVLVLLMTKGQAMETWEIVEEQTKALELNEIEEAAEPYLGNLQIESIQLEEGLETLLNTGLSEIGVILKRALRSGLVLLAVVFFEGVLAILYEQTQSTSLSALSLAVVLAITTVSAADVKSLIGLGEQTMVTMTKFANILFPAVTALAAATGAITGGAARQMAAILFSDLLMNLMTNFLVPIIYGYIAAVSAYAAVGNESIKRIAALLKWIVSTVLTALVITFVSYLTISGVISGQTDKAALKAAKFAFSSAIPVVGKLLSDAAESVLAGVGILKGSVGVFGMLAVLGICVIPFLRLGVHYLMYKVTAALAATVGESRTVGLIENIGSAFGFVIGMAGAEMLMLLLAIISALSVTSL